jgi:hypothetical protein
MPKFLKNITHPSIVPEQQNVNSYRTDARVLNKIPDVRGA